MDKTVNCTEFYKFAFCSQLFRKLKHQVINIYMSNTITRVTKVCNVGPIYCAFQWYSIFLDILSKSRIWHFPLGHTPEEQLVCQQLLPDFRANRYDLK